MVNTGLRAALTVLLCLAVTTASPRHRRASSLSLSTSSFGTSLYKRLVSGNHDNIIYSPLSVYTALTMTLLGAGGVTERELMTTLAVQPGQNIHSDLHTLMTSLTTNDPASNLTLRMANALYYDAAQVKVTDGFADNINRYYGAALKPFQKPNPEEAINTWVEEVTKHAITNFLQPGYITGDVILMLLNAVFFEASWKTMFDPRVTHDADFTTISGAVKQVPLMSKDESFSVKNVPELDARVLELPYKGGDYSLFVILPNTKNGLTNMEDKLTGQVLESALSSMPHAIPRKVYLPKFTLRMRKGLNEPLKALGLNAMFEAGRANFSEMVAGGGIFVSDTLHEAMIEVTESGTKAAAVTSITFSRNLILPDPETLFKADHAFAFVLRDKANGVNLFMGRVADPQ
ncbi:serpin B6-like [Pomacea canaliculata]|nr:serpin B6-like [Pomacea canaliculata]